MFLLKRFQGWLVAIGGWLATIATGVGFRKFVGRVTGGGGQRLANDDHWRLA